MKRVLLSLFALVISFSFLIHDADARRFGGGKSFGMQRTLPPRQSAAPAPQPQQPASAAPAAPKKNGWVGPLAGLAAGLGLAALFSHLGLGGAMANVVMLVLLALAAILVFQAFARRNAPAAQYAGIPGPGSGVDPLPAVSGLGGATSSLPHGFDAQAFVREAKLNFIRLQAAFDAANLDDLRTFTSPEVFAELRMQISERGTASQTTDVMSLDAEVLEAMEEGNQQRVSVRFTGLVREAPEQGAEPLDEIWHLTKSTNDPGGWVVAGVQQG